MISTSIWVPPGPVLVPFGVTFRSRRPPKNDIDSESDSEVNFGSAGAPSEIKKCCITLQIFLKIDFLPPETLRDRFRALKCCLVGDKNYLKIVSKPVWKNHQQNNNNHIVPERRQNDSKKVPKGNKFFNAGLFL